MFGAEKDPRVSFSESKRDYYSLTTLPFGHGSVTIGIHTGTLREDFHAEALRQGLCYPNIMTVSQGLKFTILENTADAKKDFCAIIFYGKDFPPGYDDNNGDPIFECQFNYPRMIQKTLSVSPIHDIREAIMLQRLARAWKHERQHLIHFAQKLAVSKDIDLSKKEEKLEEEQVKKYLRQHPFNGKSLFQVSFEYPPARALISPIPYVKIPLLS
jgi:hypothetical protein